MVLGVCWIPVAEDSVRGIQLRLHTRGGGFRPRYVGVTCHLGRRIPSAVSVLIRIPMAEDSVQDIEWSLDRRIPARG